MKKTVVALVTLAVLAFAADARAGTIITFPTGVENEGHEIHGQVEFEFDVAGEELCLTLENLSPHTYGAAQLLTGFSFTLAGITDSLSFNSATAPGITVDGDGVITTTVPPIIDLLTARVKQNGTTGPTWEVIDWGGASSFFMKFNPDAEYALIGPEEADGKYSVANGGILDNDGHNPFSWKYADFCLDVPGLTADTEITNAVLWFGTDFGGSLPPDRRIPPNEVVPLPNGAWLGLGMLLAMGIVRIRRRRASRAV